MFCFISSLFFIKRKELLCLLASESSKSDNIQYGVLVLGNEISSDSRFCSFFLEVAVALCPCCRDYQASI
jgi:hypothetical protein